MSQIEAVSNGPTTKRLTDRNLRAAVLDHSIFDPHNPHVRQDIIQTIIQYLQDAGYYNSSMILQDETNVKVRNAANKRSQMRRMKRAVLDGDWSEVERLLGRTAFKSMKAFRYAVHRQQFLELVDAQESQKAFTILQRRLKELEAYARTPDEFRDLCYLLTCKSVSEAASFRDWDGVGASRAALVEQYSRLLEFDTFQRDAYIPPGGNGALERQVPPGRLVHLLQQALAFQIGSSRHMPNAPPRIGTLLEDYESALVPNSRQVSFVGHTGNVKCVTFVGEEGCTLASGSSDNCVRLWDAHGGGCKSVLKGHTSRIWDVSATANGMLLASGSGDGTVRIWDTGGLVEGGWRKDDDGGSIGAGTGVCRAVLKGHASDVYTVRFHPRGNVIVSAGYDRCVRLFDAETHSVLKVFNGHKGSISSVAFNARGNVIITGSKDSTIKFWDVISGLCIKTISSHLGEVTSVETNRSGTLMLSGSKDNSNRLWDIRMNRAVRRFKGHQNTSKNFIRTRFGPLENVVVGGSEDGFVYVWDVETTDVIQKLGPCGGAVYDAAWNGRQSILASCSHDGVVTSWCYDDSLDLP